MTAASWLPLLHELADRADAIALRLFRHRALRVEEKADHSPVTEADRAIEDAVRDVARQRHPGLGVLGEEGGVTGARGGDGADRRLIVDPIDGTRNFVRGVPVFATLLAVEEAGEVVAGVVSAPALGEGGARWHAARGAGAFHGERPLRVSGIDDLARAELFHGGLGPGEGGAPPPGLTTLIGRVRRDRGFGDFYQHVLVAEGGGEISVDVVVQPWDIAAPQVIVEEAGGRATTLGGDRSIYGGSLVCSNGLLHAAALAALAGLG